MPEEKQMPSPAPQGGPSNAGALAPAGARVRLKTDPALERTDRYGRLLGYVYRGSRNLNMALVRKGAATVWFVGVALYTIIAGRKVGANYWDAQPNTMTLEWTLPSPVPFRQFEIQPEVK